MHAYYHQRGACQSVFCVSVSPFFSFLCTLLIGLYVSLRMLLHNVLKEITLTYHTIQHLNQPSSLQTIVFIFTLMATLTIKTHKSILVEASSPNQSADELDIQKEEAPAHTSRLR